MPSLSHLTSCTPTKSNLYLANSLASAIGEPALYWLQTFQVPNLMSLFHCLGRNKVSVKVWGFVCEYFITRYFFVRSCQHLSQPPSWRTTPYRLCADAYSIYSQLPSILEAVCPSTTWGHAMPWWQGRTYHMESFIPVLQKLDSWFYLGDKYSMFLFWKTNSVSEYVKLYKQVFISSVLLEIDQCYWFRVQAVWCMTNELLFSGKK